MPPVEKAVPAVWEEWWKLALVALFVIAGIVLFTRLRQPALSPAERDAFVDRIRRQIGTAERA